MNSRTAEWPGWAVTAFHCFFRGSCTLGTDVQQMRLSFQFQRRDYLFIATENRDMLRSVTTTGYPPKKASSRLVAMITGGVLTASMPASVLSDSVQRMAFLVVVFVTLISDRLKVRGPFCASVV